MKKLVRNAKGFTLIELMIVVAIIGILAAIAIPQFAAYRMRAFNASAESDVRNVKTAEEVLMGDHQHYGSTQKDTQLDSTMTVTAAGEIAEGPLNGATTDVKGAAVTGTGSGVNHGIGIGVGNRVYIQSVADANFASYIAYSHHFQGHRVFGTEGDSTAIMFCQNDTATNTFVGKVEFAGATLVTAPTASTVELTSATTCGGSPNANWAAM